jgi:F-type H+-transporting ATPase subunit a
MEHPPNIYLLFEGAVPVAIQTLAVSTVAVLLLAWYAGRKLGEQAVIPDGRLTVGSFLELLFEGVAGLAQDLMGDKWLRYIPLVGTLALFILVANLLGLVPGGGGATQFVETNLTWAIMAVVVAEGSSIYEHGFFGWLARFNPGPWWLAPLMFPIELFSHMIRMGTLTIRLTANMFADHTLLAIFLSFPIIQLFVPWVVMGLGLFIAFIQAFIFSYLTMTYIGEALAEAH